MIFRFTLSCKIHVVQDPMYFNWGVWRILRASKRDIKKVLVRSTKILTIL